MSCSLSDGRMGQLYAAYSRRSESKEKKKLEFFFTANAEKMTLDGQGRITLNEELRRQVELLGQKEAEVFGNNNRIEIWNCDLFKEELGDIDEEEVEDILDEYGI